MRIALVSDIHANLPALNAVLTDIRRDKITEIWNLGDLLGYGPFPNETVALARAKMAHHILGNYDAKVLMFEARKDQWKNSKDPVKYFSFQWTSDHLSSVSRTFLKGLPAQKTVRKGGLTFLLVHGSPKADDEGLTGRTPLSRFRALARGIDADVVLCGHSHFPFNRRAGRVLFVNPGSVGRPFDADPRSSYSILTVLKSRVEVCHRRVGYDLRSLQDRMEKQDFPPELFRSISSGQSLDTMTSR